jgi:hypothetical protein
VRLQKFNDLIGTRTCDLQTCKILRYSVALILLQLKLLLLILLLLLLLLLLIIIIIILMNNNIFGTVSDKP